jgi:hypothetical protein
MRGAADMIVVWSHWGADEQISARDSPPEGAADVWQLAAILAGTSEGGQSSGCVVTLRKKLFRLVTFVL